MTNEAVELSPKAKEWLNNHRLMSKARNIKESNGRIEFVLKGRRQGLYELNVVYLPRGDWSSHEITGKDLKENY